MSLDVTSFWGLAGLVLAVVGIAVTVVVAVRYADRKKPKCYGVTYVKITSAEDAPRDIQIAYKGTPVERVASSFVWFWNGGRRPIMRHDIPPTHPLLLRIRDNGGYATILDFSIRRVSRVAINLEAQRLDDTSVRLAFDFLDFGDGCALEVHHTGGPLSSPEVSGVILGAPAGVQVTTHRSSKDKRQERISLPTLEGQYRRGAEFSRSMAIKRTVQVTLAVAAVVLVAHVAELFVRDVLGLDWKLGIARYSHSEADLRTGLSNHLTGARLDSAVEALKAAGRDELGLFGRGLSRVVFVAAVPIGLLIILVSWSRPYPFPNSLLLDKPIHSGP